VHASCPTTLIPLGRRVQVGGPSAATTRRALSAVVSREFLAAALSAGASGSLVLARSVLVADKDDFMMGLKQRAAFKACVEGDPLTLKALLEFSVDVNAPRHKALLYASSFTGRTLLVTACGNNQPACVRVLCQSPGIDVNLKYGALSALQVSCKVGALQCVKALLASKDIHCDGASGSSPGIHLACAHDRPEIVAALLGDARTDPVVCWARNGDNWRPLHSAAQCGRWRCIEVLLTDARTDVNTTDDGGRTPLMLACMNGCPRSVAALLTAKVDFIATELEDGWSALDYASAHGKLECIKLLHAKCPADDWQVLLRREKNGWPALIVPLVSQCPGPVQVMQLLIGTCEADVNARGLCGTTALIESCRNNDPRCIDVLARAGADPNVAANNGDTAIGCAVRGRFKACVDRLLAMPGINVNVYVDNGGMTPLMCAVRHGDLRLAEKLLAVPGANPNMHLPERVRVVGDFMVCERETALSMACKYLTPIAGLGRTSSDYGEHARSGKNGVWNYSMVEAVLIGGGCRSFGFGKDVGGGYNRMAMQLKGVYLSRHKQLAGLFKSGVDFWQRKLHKRHSAWMHEAVATVLLVHARSRTEAIAGPASVRLPVEMWLLILAHLRGADAPVLD